MKINRRRVLGGAGLAGAAAATGAGVDRLLSDGTPGFRTDRVELEDEDATRFGDPRLPAETITSKSHLFRLGAQPPTTLHGGSFQQADEDNFPILKGQEASILLLKLEPGGIREPHWHPSAWEINVVTGGVATWAVIDGNGNHEAFDQHEGDVVFAPQGSFHYFENRGPGEMNIVIIQNTSAPETKDNIGIGESLSRLPPRVLSAVFGVPAETFNSFKKIDGAITILKSSP
ncbi:cupin domain-containing protein [Mycobacterium sp. UM_CSW]|uniref:cupin domain-containing protein n=1 Tax=Mycobacterium sp. UM_CSW TaxID=1370119 RepID=UPI0008377786|nr:cupin domain-containing protein [Mycobacterium sp. UM_CSW]